jgi:hypothetical protein
MKISGKTGGNRETSVSIQVPGPWGRKAVAEFPEKRKKKVFRIFPLPKCIISYGLDSS